MKLVLQRVSRAEVRVGERRLGRIGRGLVVLLAAERGDDGGTAEEAARKVAGLRIFADENGKMNLALADVAGSVLVVSQFTLAADLTRGRRPSFERALPAEQARPLYDHFARTLELLGIDVATGAFGAMMDVELVNEGPATFLIEIRPQALSPRSLPSF